MMHGQKNIKLCNSEQAKWVYQYKKWYNWPSWWWAACCSKHVEECSV